jgi:hypothetical protein
VGIPYKFQTQGGGLPNYEILSLWKRCHGLTPKLSAPSCILLVLEGGIVLCRIYLSVILIRHLNLVAGRRSFTAPVLVSRLVLKLQKDYNLPEKERNDRLLKKPLKLLKRKLLGKGRLLSKLAKQMNSEWPRSRLLMMRRLESSMRRRR